MFFIDGGSKCSDFLANCFHFGFFVFSYFGFVLFGFIWVCFRTCQSPLYHKQSKSGFEADLEVRFCAISIALEWLIRRMDGLFYEYCQHLHFTSYNEGDDTYSQFSRDGSTAIVAIIIGNTLLLANCGDSGCFLSLLILFIPFIPFDSWKFHPPFP